MLDNQSPSDWAMDLAMARSISTGFPASSKGVFEVEREGRRPRLSQMVRVQWTSMNSSKKVMFGTVNPKTEDLIFLKSVIDRCYLLEQAANAHRYVETDCKTGHVALSLAHS